MEDELRCGVCRQLYNNPVLLPCCHAVCLNCAVHLQQPAGQGANNGALPPPPPSMLAAAANSGSSSSSCSGSVDNGGDHVPLPPSTASVASTSSSSSSSDAVGSGGASAAGSVAGSDILQEMDKLSILSETDSGVVCTSRPNSYVGTPNNAVFPPLSASTALSLACPVPGCGKVVYFDENGAHNLPKYRAMQSIVDKYGETRQLVIHCQLCESEPAAEATVMCEQCEVLYCEACREACHPLRGPLARHSLLEPRQGKAALRTKLGRGEAACAEHADEALSLYCLVCRTAVCALCLHDTRHAHHDVQAINAMCKAQKTELSQNLQQLSEKAKTTTEFIQRLKGMADKVNENSSELEAQVEAQVRSLALALEERRASLLDFVRADRDVRLRALKEQVAQCTTKLQQTTGLIQFCIEALKETDPPAFLQVGAMLISRVANADLTLYRDVATQARISPHADLTLDDQSARRAIQHLNFIQMKPAKDGEERRPAAPGAPAIIPEECQAENNSVTVAWQPPPTSCVQGYVLELDDGHGGEFRDVYCGKETICTVDGLHFNSMYNARVKAFNSSGEGEYSEVIGLQTAEVAWFTFDPGMSPGLQFSADHCALSCPGYEHRVALGSVGFSRGVHYWEFSVDRYDSDTDPSFGVARADVAKDQMLGKDDKGWAMYIDRQRSWFLHGDAHAQRCEGGIQTGSTVGVLLDLDRHQLSFYVNEEPQGPIAFHDLYGVFYPAVSVNRGVSVTLHTALDPPTDVDDT